MCCYVFLRASFSLFFLIRQYVLYRKGNNHAVPKSEQLLARYCFVQIMGPNPLKLCEEMILAANEIVGSGTASSSSVVLDLGSGTGITTALLAREFGCVAYAADLWSNPTENMRFFETLGLTNRQIVPIKADASGGLPFAEEFFDAVVSIDSYNYFGRSAEYLDAKLLPYVKRGGIVALCFPGMKQDCHENQPACLLESWTPDQLDYIHDIPWWKAIFEQSENADILGIREMQCTEEAWADWLLCDNEYARCDASAVKACALEYLNTIMVVLRKK